MTNEFERAAQPETPAKKTRRRLRDHQDSELKTDQPIRWVQLRIIPIWLRVILVVILWIVMAGVGLTIGYSFIGDGQADDALKWGTWQHLLDIMNGK